MNGYFTQQGFIGFVNGKKMLFENDSEYYAYMEGDKNGNEDDL